MGSIQLSSRQRAPQKCRALPAAGLQDHLAESPARPRERLSEVGRRVPPVPERQFSTEGNEGNKDCPRLRFLCFLLSTNVGEPPLLFRHFNHIAVAEPEVRRMV